MKIAVVFAVAALASAAPALALAQATPQAEAASPASPEKIDLARRVVAASGGADQAKALYAMVFQSLRADMDKNLPPEQKRLQAVLYDKMQGRMVAMTSKVMDLMVQVYADNLSVKELQDQLTWLESDSAQSMRRKSPAIMSQTLRLVMPMMVQFSDDLKTDVLDEVCKEATCSTEDRRRLETALNQALPKPTS